MHYVAILALVLCKAAAFTAHFADFDGAQIGARNNLLNSASPLYPETFDKMTDMNWSESDWEGLLFN